MTAVSIVRENQDDEKSTFRAVAHTGNIQAVGRTAGEALDALTARLGPEAGSTLVVVQQMQPDCFFSAEQIARLQFLMQRSQAAAEGTGLPLTFEEESERNGLIEVELFASARRAGALADALGLSFRS